MPVQPASGTMKAAETSPQRAAASSPSATPQEPAPTQQLSAGLQAQDCSGAAQEGGQVMGQQATGEQATGEQVTGEQVTGEQVTGEQEQQQQQGYAMTHQEGLALVAAIQSMGAAAVSSIQNLAHGGTQGPVHVAAGPPPQQQLHYQTHHQQVQVSDQQQQQQQQPQQQQQEVDYSMTDQEARAFMAAIKAQGEAARNSLHDLANSGAKDLSP
eukprot:TRINITY_DN4853_c0_g2_i3.p2 TRINITY_DN4853_c0_g2~~TRINITY_DN4853_c0_g2_i3.p2  ORF type:complete len:213 (+),score=90.20 TRINITY_DN4853_c0_g2_i3:269-907(+)